MKDTEYDAVDFIRARNRHIPFKDSFKYLINDSYKGIAKCHPNDEFDIEKGKEIAKARAVHKHNRALFNKVRAYIEKNTEENEHMMSIIDNKYEKSLERLNGLNK